MAALDTVTGTTTAPGAVITAVTVASGDTLAVRNTNPGVGIWLLSIISHKNAAGITRLRSPRLHDNVQGIRAQVQALTPLPLIAHWPLQRLFPQDALILEATGSAVAGQIESEILVIYYEDVPGSMARFIAPDDLQRRGVNVLTQQVNLVPGAGGGYTGSRALNADFDFMVANTDYALLGATYSATSGVVTMKGIDTGNLRVAIPALASMPQLTKDWFWRLSTWSRLPLIPIFNSANKGGITVETVQTQAATALNVSFNFVQLAPPTGPQPQQPAGAAPARQ